MPPSPSKSKSSARIAAQLGGQRGEALAALFLRLKLYRVVERRYKTPVGEIDLIVERFGVTVFVEVKARSKAASEGETLEAVNQQRIVRAAQYWLARNPAKAETPLRFDVMFLTPWRWPRHLRNAFGSEGF
jgi:putative endonuclease